MGAKCFTFAQTATKHTGLPARYVLGWLAHQSWDDDYIGRYDPKSLRDLTGMKKRALERAIHEIACSGEVVFYDKPDGTIAYHMLWAFFFEMNKKGETPPIPMEWPLEYRQLGTKCPRPKRMLWTEKEEHERKRFRVIHAQMRQDEAEERRQSRRKNTAQEG